METEHFITAVPIEEICNKIFNGNVLDVFFLIYKINDGKHLSKADLIEQFHIVDGIETISQNKYRLKVNESIAKLEGSLFIDSYKDVQQGSPVRYFLTKYGEAARPVLKKMYEENPKIIIGTKILSKEWS